jgi:hypothetical protein
MNHLKDKDSQSTYPGWAGHHASNGIRDPKRSAVSTLLSDKTNHLFKRKDVLCDERVDHDVKTDSVQVLAGLGTSRDQPDEQ